MNKFIGKEIKTRVSRIWLDEEGILRIDYFPGSEETLEDAQTNHAALIEIAGKKKYPVFINSGNQKYVNREARIYYTKNAPKVATAIAGLITSTYIHVLANFYMELNRAINKNTLPLKFFKSEAKALAWLRDYRD